MKSRTTYDYRLKIIYDNYTRCRRRNELISYSTFQSVQCTVEQDCTKHELKWIEICNAIIEHLQVIYILHL